ncbi:hypothetical protein pb186bvf_015510 [Paramecium bursaria]
MRSRSHLFQKTVKTIQIANFLHRLRDTDTLIKVKDALRKEYLWRTESEQQQIYQIMSQVNYFIKIKDKYGDDFAQETCKFLYIKSYLKGMEIFLPKTTCIIVSGLVKANQEYDHLRPKSFNEIHDQIVQLEFGDSFNEIGLGEITKSVCHAQTQVEVACLDYKVFNDISNSMRSNYANEKLQFFKQINYFSFLTENEIKYIAFHIEHLKIQRNHVIYYEGDINCEWIYFVKSGDIQLLKMHEQDYVKLTNLQEYEIFGEESLLGYEQRMFTCKCINDLSFIYRITKVEFEKRIWYPEARRMLFNIISQKWIFRFQRIAQLTKQEQDIPDLQQHIEQMNLLLEPENIQTLQIKIPIPEAPETDRISEPKTDRAQVTCSLMLKNLQIAHQMLKTKDVEIKTPTSHASIYRQYLKLPEQKKNKQKEVKHSFKKLSSKFTFIQNVNQNQPLQEQLNSFVQLEKVKDSDVDWGDDGTLEDKNKKIKGFYETIGNYAKYQYYQNQDLLEATSTRARVLNIEYKKLQQQQKNNITNVFTMQAKPKSDNMLRKEYFLRQLKKMQKRLKVLQMIKKGILTMKANQYVNDEGDIVDFEDPTKDDDVYQMIDGVRQLRFNFITQSQNIKQNNQPDLNQQIIEQKEQIVIVKEIVSGKLSPDQLNQSIDKFRKTSDHKLRDGEHKVKDSEHLFSRSQISRAESFKLRIQSGEISKREFSTQTPMVIKTLKGNSDFDLLLYIFGLLLIYIFKTQLFRYPNDSCNPQLFKYIITYFMASIRFCCINQFKFLKLKNERTKQLRFYFLKFQIYLIKQ